MRHLILLSLLTSLYTLPTIGFAAEPPKTVVKATSKVSFLFVLRAHSGTITPVKDGYQLTLLQVDNTLLYFSNRPARKAGMIPIDHLMNLWNSGVDSFRINPPNAAILHSTLKSNKQGTTPAVAIELSHPLFENNQLTFHLKPIHGLLVPGQYQNIVLFIDCISASNSFDSETMVISSPM